MQRIQFPLNTATPQYTRSKTWTAIQYIKYYSILSRNLRGDEHGIHYLTVVVTNCSLAETEQWKYRLKNGTDHMNIHILSSKQTSDHRNIQSLLGKMVMAKTPNDLPDVIVMCTHQKRIDDLITLFDAFKMRMTLRGIRGLNLTIMFDEADKNTGLISDFLKSISTMVEIRENGWYDNILSSVHFITATPFEDFWKDIGKVGIHSLGNIHHLLATLTPDDCIHLQYDDLLAEYRKITDHIHCPLEMDTQNTLEYAMMVMSKILSTGRRDTMTVFAPAEDEIVSHMAMRDYFNAIGFWVLILNGRCKGFYSPRGEFQTIDSLRKDLGVTGELYEVLRAWRQRYPDNNLAVTGYQCVERGLTFCTTGFSWSDIIISSYHARSIASLVQLFGRANGGKQYVEIANIWSPTSIIRAVNDRIELLNALLRKNPRSFKSKDFRERTERDNQEPCKHVPIVIPLTFNQYTDMNTSKKGRRWNIDTILPIIAMYDASLPIRLTSFKKKQVSESSSGPSYKKHIADLIHSAQRNHATSIDIKDESLTCSACLNHQPPGIRHTCEKKEDLYQIFIDGKDKNKMILLMYSGSRYGEEMDTDSDSE
jgi:hypothetical protein